MLFRICFLYILSIVSSSFAASGKGLNLSTQIIFNIKKGCNLYLSYPRNLVKNNQIFIEHSPTDTTVSITVMLSRPFNIFNTNKGATPYLIMPGFTYNCTLHDSLETQWRFECTDKQKAFESNALNELQKQTERFDLNATTVTAKAVRSADNYNMLIDDAFTRLYHKRLDALKKFYSNEDLSPSGYNALKNYIYYDYLLNRLRPVYMPRFAHKPLPAWYADSLLRTDLTTIDTAYAALYPVKGVCIYINRLQAIKKFSDTSLPNTFSLAKQLPNNEVRNVLLYQIMQLQRDQSSETFKHYTDSLAKYCSNYTLTQLIRENLKEALIVSKSKDIVYTLANKPVPISDLLSIRDSLLYIDFWASWCMPCLNEMPASVELRQNLKNQPIRFCYISIDSKGDHWKSKSKDIGLTENSFWLPDTERSAFVHNLRVQTIPRYVIVKNGNVIDENAPRPSDKNLKQILLNYLDRK